MDYAIKTAMEDPDAAEFVFTACKTMYGGKKIAAGDTLYIFQSETSGGRGLVARGTVLAADPVAPAPGVPRPVPRVTLSVRRTGSALRPLGRAELKPFRDWSDGRPETELNFKYYRQATDKIVGLSPAAAGFLAGYF